MVSVSDMMALAKDLGRLPALSHRAPLEMGRQMRSTLPTSATALVKSMSPKARRDLLKLVREGEAEHQHRSAAKRRAARG